MKKSKLWVIVVSLFAVCLLAARTGLVGVFLWLVYLTYLFRHVYLLEKKTQAGVLPVLYFFTCILTDSVFQYTFSPVVIMGIVFVLLDLAYRTTMCGMNKNGCNTA